jgi:ribosome biogenesis GTPase
MSDVTSGGAEVFDDVIAITLECRFTNCTHADEPHRAIRAAAAAGTLESTRLARWRKLTDEDAVNTGVAAPRRAPPGKNAGRD